MSDGGQIRKANLHATDADREIIAACDFVDHGDFLEQARSQDDRRYIERDL